MTGRSDSSVPYLVGWDEDVGLWVQHEDGKTGKTDSVHIIRASAWRLASAGLDGVLSRLPAGRALRRIREAQATTGGKRGCFWWKWEDVGVTDTNSGFFTSLGLLVLRLESGRQLAPEDLAVLDGMLRECVHWFRLQTDGLDERRLRYPNMCLGDLVCRWLLMELFEERNDPVVEELVARAVAYWRDCEWGWGEHLSDLYAKVTQGELVALLVLAKRLPPGTAAAVEALLRELDDIDMAYAGGPRVPTIRCYSMQESPWTPERREGWCRPYRDLMVDEAVREAGASFQCMAALAHRRGLRERLGAARAPGGSVETACYRGAVALARVEPDWRIGVMSRYPVMEDTDHIQWGLHWQSMPVAFHHRRGDWGYLQWEAEEHGTVRALPARGRHDRPSCVLSDDHPQAAVGRTFGFRRGSAFLALRRLDAVASGWPCVIDRFRLVSSTVSAPVTDESGGWRRVLLDYGGSVLTLAFRPLEGDVRSSCGAAGASEWRWDHAYTWTGASPKRLAGLWLLSMGAGPAELPAVEPDAGRWRVLWSDGGTLELDPFAEPASGAFRVSGHP